MKIKNKMWTLRSLRTSLRKDLSFRILILNVTSHEVFIVVVHGSRIF